MQKTAYEMRISDWSSDVCSSDLDRGRVERGAETAVGLARAQPAGLGIEAVPPISRAVIEAVGDILPPHLLRHARARTVVIGIFARLRRRVGLAVYGDIAEQIRIAHGSTTVTHA